MKKTITFLLTVTIIILGTNYTSLTHAEDVQIIKGRDEAGKPITQTVQAAAPGDLETIFANIISISGILVGFGFFIMLTVGGMRYLFSAGDPKALQAAKGTITWAIIGLALFAISFTILSLIQAFTGVNVTVFRILLP